jgi:hypothetical protein
MPPEKEIAFFESERDYQRGLDWYQHRVLRGAPADACCGTASVGYMSGTPHRDIPLDGWSPSLLAHGERIEDTIPRRIRAALPDAKLLCVLRDPVERAFSHYRMAVLDGLESRSFDKAVSELLEPRALQHARAVATGYNGYIARGEYGRILAGFLRAFPQDQLSVIFSVDLAQDTINVLPSAFRFVGVSPDFIPDNLDKRYRDAAVQQRIRGLNLDRWRSRAIDVPAIRAIRDRIPPASRAAIGRSIAVANYRLELWNARRDLAGDAELAPSVRETLRAHFRPDSEILASSLGLDLPWLEAWRL